MNNQEAASHSHVRHAFALALALVLVLQHQHSVTCMHVTKESRGPNQYELSVFVGTGSPHVEPITEVLDH